MKSIIYVTFYQGLDTRVNTQKKLLGFLVKPVEKKTQQKPAPHLIRFQFVMPVIIKLLLA